MSNANDIAATVKDLCNNAEMAAELDALRADLDIWQSEHDKLLDHLSEMIQHNSELELRIIALQRELRQLRADIARRELRPV